jgi:hypothetical protein
MEVSDHFTLKNSGNSTVQFALECANPAFILSPTSG